MGGFEPTTSPSKYNRKKRAKGGLNQTGIKDKKSSLKEIKKIGKSNRQQLIDGLTQTGLKVIVSFLLVGDSNPQSLPPHHQANLITPTKTKLSPHHFTQCT